MALPWDEAGNLQIVVTEKAIAIPADCLVYHPQTIAVVVESCGPEEDLVAAVEQLLMDQGLAPAALAGVVTAIRTSGPRIDSSLGPPLSFPLRLGAIGQQGWCGCSGID